MINPASIHFGFEINIMNEQNIEEESRNDAE